MKSYWMKNWRWIVPVLAGLIIFATWASHDFPMPGTNNQQQESQTTGIADSLQQELLSAMSTIESLEGELDSRPTDCEGQFKEGYNAGLDTAAVRQEEESQMKAKLQLDQARIPAISWGTLNLDYLSYIDDADDFFTYFRRCFFNVDFLRGVYSDPNKLRNTYNAQKNRIKGAVEFLGLTATIQNVLAELQPLVGNTLVTNVFWKAYQQDHQGVYDDTSGEKLKELGLPVDEDGNISLGGNKVKAQKAYQRWCFLQRRYNEMEAHGSNRGVAVNTYQQIINDAYRFFQ